MASTVVDFLMSEHRYQEAIEVAQVILRNYPLDGYTLVKLGSAYGELMHVEIADRFPNLNALPPALRQQYLWLAEGNRRAFQAVETLGWEPPR